MKRTSYEEAIVIYKKHYGTEPTFEQITSNWHGYAANYKQYKGFEDYLVNTAE